MTESDCPLCGAAQFAAKPLPVLEHPVFDDTLHAIVVNGERRHVQFWRLLTLLRRRYKRMVPRDAIALYLAKDPMDGGSLLTVRHEISGLRALLQGTPFRIVRQYGYGYGLFPL
jgi:hypothetical protein